MVTDYSSHQNKNDSSSGERLTGLLQQTAVPKNNPLGSGGRGGLGGRGGRLSMNAPNMNIIVQNLSPEVNKTSSSSTSSTPSSRDSPQSPILQIISSEKNSNLMKQAVAKSNPLSGGRGSLTAASPVKKNMDEMMKISLQDSPVVATDDSGASTADSSNRETFGEIKRRFEEASVNNSTVPLVGALSRTNSVSIGSLGLGVTSPGAAAAHIVSPSWNKAEKRPSVGIMQPQLGSRSMSMAARGPMISSSLSASSDGGESGISLRLENFEEIKQKFESLAESKDSKDVVPRARRGSAVNLGNAVSSPGGVLPVSATGASLAALQLPGPVVSADSAKLTAGRLSLSAHSYDSGMVTDRAQAPVMLQAVARSNPLVSGGRGVGGPGRGGRTSLASTSYDRSTEAAAVAAVIGRVPLNWQSNVAPPSAHVAQNSPIVVSESFVEKKRNYEKSLVAAQSTSQTPSQRQQQLQQHQQHQQQLQQFMMRTDPMRTPTDPSVVGSSSSATRVASSSSATKSANRYSQIMDVAVAKSNPLGSRSATAAGRGKGPSSVERTLRKDEGSESSDATDSLASPALEAVPTARQPVSRPTSVDHGTLSSRSQAALAMLASTPAASAPAPTAALGVLAAIADSAPGLLTTPAFITRGHSDLKASVVPDRQLEIMQQAVTKSNPLSGGGGRGSGRRASVSRALETPITPAGNIQSSIEMEGHSETRKAPLQEVLTPFPPSSPRAAANYLPEADAAAVTVAASIASEELSPAKRRPSQERRHSIDSMENRNPVTTSSSSNSSNNNHNHSQDPVPTILTSAVCTPSLDASPIPGSNPLSPPILAAPTSAAPAAASVYSTLDLSAPVIRLPSADIGLDEYAGGGGGGMGNFAQQTRLAITAPPTQAGGGSAVGSRQMEIMQQAVTRSNPLGGRGRRRSMVET